MFKLEYFRNALLVTLVLMLVYVLYKRLLRVIGRDNIQTKYPAIGNTLEMTGTEATIVVELANSAYLVVTICDSDGNLREHLGEGEFAKGTHRFSVSLSTLPSGKYFYKVTSPYQEASQYFTID